MCLCIATNLQVGSSLVLISENTSGLHNELSSSLGPWDLLRVPSISIIIKYSTISQIIQVHNHIYFSRWISMIIIVWRLEFIPDTKNSDCLLTKEKGLGVLHFEFMVLPLTVNTVILEHVCLQQQTNNYNTHTTNSQQTHFTHFLKFTIGLRIWRRKKERKGNGKVTDAKIQM